jgi:hypothetical protein
MSKKELVLLASRVFALLLFSWALAEITYLPERLFALFHHLNERSVLATHDYWSTYYAIIITFLAARIFVLLIAAVLFWKCGMWLQNLLLPPENVAAEPSSVP